MPDSITVIRHNAFGGCQELKTILIPKNVTQIDYEAFWNCKSLTRILIPDNVTNIEYGAFGNCPGLTDVYYFGSESKWNEISISEWDNTALTSATIHYNFILTQGDVNVDGKFTIADVVSLQNWLLCVPNTELINWKAADLCEDDRIDVFDLCMMKKMLVNS